MVVESRHAVVTRRCWVVWRLRDVGEAKSDLVGQVGARFHSGGGGCPEHGKGIHGFGGSEQRRRDSLVSRNRLSVLLVGGKDIRLGMVRRHALEWSMVCCVAGLALCVWLQSVLDILSAQLGLCALRLRWDRAGFLHSWDGRRCHGRLCKTIRLGSRNHVEPNSLNTLVHHGRLRRRSRWLGWFVFIHGISNGRGGLRAW